MRDGAEPLARVAELLRRGHRRLCAARRSRALCAARSSAASASPTRGRLREELLGGGALRLGAAARSPRGSAGAARMIELRLRVDEQIARRHHALAFLQPGEHFPHVIPDPPERDASRLVFALAFHHIDERRRRRAKAPRCAAR